MQYKLLGSTGLRVSELCLGAMLAGLTTLTLIFTGHFAGECSVRCQRQLFSRYRL